MKSKLLVYIPFLQLLSVFALLSIAGNFSSCKEKEEGFEVHAITEGRFDVNENEYVTMQIVSEEETKFSSAFLRIENHTERCLGHGNNFSLQYYSKSNWGQDLLRGVAWEEIYYCLLAGDAKEMKDILSFVKEYNKREKGKYKLTKQFSLHSDWFSGSGDVIGGIILSVEFEIQ